MADKVRIAIIGAGAVADYHHVPGIRLDPRHEESALARNKRDARGRRRGGVRFVRHREPGHLAAHADEIEHVGTVARDPRGKNRALPDFRRERDARQLFENCRDAGSLSNARSAWVHSH